MQRSIADKQGQSADLTVYLVLAWWFAFLNWALDSQVLGRAIRRASFR